MGKDRNIFSRRLEIYGGRKSNKIYWMDKFEKGCITLLEFFPFTLLLTEVKFNHIMLINLNPYFVKYPLINLK